MKCAISQTVLRWNVPIDMGEASPPNATHRTRWRDKVGLSDVMASLFLPDDFLEPFSNFFVGASVAQPRAQVVFGHTEQASSYLAVRRQTDAIAVATERLADRSDNADFATAIGEDPAFCCR